MKVVIRDGQAFAQEHVLSGAWPLRVIMVSYEVPGL